MRIVDRLKQVFTYDTDAGQVTRRDIHGAGHSQRPVGFKGAGGYLYASIDGRSYPLHRIAWALRTGEWPMDRIYFINKDRTDLRFANLTRNPRHRYVDHEMPEGARTAPKMEYLPTDDPVTQALKAWVGRKAPLINILGMFMADQYLPAFRLAKVIYDVDPPSREALFEATELLRDDTDRQNRSHLTGAEREAAVKKDAQRKADRYERYLRGEAL